MVNFIRGKKSAFTLFKIDEGMDSGDIICQEVYEISHKDYAEDVHKKVYKSLKSSIRTKMRDLMDCKLKLKSQNHEKARYLFIRRPEDGIIDWNDDIEDIHRLIRATSRPYLGEFTYYNYSLES